MWFASGWSVVGRMLRGRTGWAKTERVAETPAAPPQTAAVGAPVPTAAPLTAAWAPGPGGG